MFNLLDLTHPSAVPHDAILWLPWNRTVVTLYLVSPTCTLADEDGGPADLRPLVCLLFPACPFLSSGFLWAAEMELTGLCWEPRLAQRVSHTCMLPSRPPDTNIPNYTNKKKYWDWFQNMCTILTWFICIDVNGLHAGSVRSELSQQGSAHHIPMSNCDITWSTKL